MVWVFVPLKTLLGIARQWSREKFSISTLKPPSLLEILIYRMWLINIPVLHKRNLKNALTIVTESVT